MAAYIYPSHEVVAVTWLKTIAGLPTNQIATTLPADNGSWAASGFVQVTAVGGTPQTHVPMFEPVVQIDCWANNPNSQKSPWGKASHLAELIVWATYTANQPGSLAVAADVFVPRLTSVTPISEPRRILDDEAGFARVQFDMAFKWTLNKGAA